MITFLYTFLLVLLPQTTESPAGNAGRYDFWLGEWELTWENKDGETYHGTNTIRRVMDGKVIEENFMALEGKLEGYEGKSWSVYNPRSDEWKQTWVDNQGAYLDFTGSKDGDSPVFQRSGVDPERKEILSRMIFYNIADDSLDWDWQQSKDKGETWDTLWHIHYNRKTS